MRLWRQREILSKNDFFEVIETTGKTQFATMVLQKDQSSGDFGNDHPQADQWVVVLEGEGQAVWEDGSQAIGPGDVVLVAAPEKHQFKCTGGTLKTITFYGPPGYPEEG